MTLKLEAGKYYKMRNGEKVYIQTLHIDKDRFRKKFVSSCGHKVFAENGDNLDWNDDIAMKQTIISEWKETERIKKVVAFYRGETVNHQLTSFVFENAGIAKQISKDLNREIVALVEIDIPVGHGITEE